MNCSDDSTAFELAYLRCVKVCLDLAHAARQQHNSITEPDCASRKQEKKVTAVLLMLRASAQRALLAYALAETQDLLMHALAETQ
eukprot:gene14559-20600_t